MNHVIEHYVARAEAGYKDQDAGHPGGDARTREKMRVISEEEESEVPDQRNKERRRKREIARTVEHRKGGRSRGRGGGTR